MPRNSAGKQSTHLLDGVRPVEAPPPVHVRRSDILARVAATTLGLDTAVAGPTVATLALFVYLVEVVLELSDDGVRNWDTPLVKTRLEDVVCNIRLGLSADVHDVQA